MVRLLPIRYFVIDPLAGGATCITSSSISLCPLAASVGAWLVRLSDARFVVGRPHYCSLDDGRNRDPNGRTGRDGGGGSIHVLCTCVGSACRLKWVWGTMRAQAVQGSSRPLNHFRQPPPRRPFPVVPKRPCCTAVYFAAGVTSCTSWWAARRTRTFRARSLLVSTGLLSGTLLFGACVGTSHFFLFFFFFLSQCTPVLRPHSHVSSHNHVLFLTSFPLPTWRPFPCHAWALARLSLACWLEVIASSSCAVVLLSWGGGSSSLPCLLFCPLVSVPVLSPSLSLSSVSFLLPPPLLPPSL